MTPEQKNLVRQSFVTLSQNSDALAATFYDRLFELNPLFRTYFSGDMTRQGRKFMEMLQLTVECLDRLDRIVPIVWSAGKRHSAYGVQASDYDTVGEALLWAVQQQSGPTFTDETRGAWKELYNLIALTMQQAGQETANTVPQRVSA